MDTGGRAACQAALRERTVFKVVHEYFATKGPEVSEKYFWKDSMAAYRWAPR